jgi:hypothetical protein
MEIKEKDLNYSVQEFISYYIDILKDIIEDDEETILLCKEIYKDNREIIDYISKNKNSINNYDKDSAEYKIFNMYNIYEKSIDAIIKYGVNNPFFDAGNRFILTNNDVIKYRANNTDYSFINKEMEKIKCLNVHLESNPNIQEFIQKALS